jgi:hypothetical protein
VNFDDPLTTPYEQLLEPTVHIELDVASRRFVENWRQKHGRAWPRQSDGRVHPLLLEAHKNIEDNHELKLEALLLQQLTSQSDSISDASASPTVRFIRFSSFPDVPSLLGFQPSLVLSPPSLTSAHAHA